MKRIVSILIPFFTLLPMVHWAGNGVEEDVKLIYPYSFAPSEGLINRFEKGCRKEICLNGYWDFQALELPSEYVQGNGIPPELPLPQQDGWSSVKIKIPSPWNINSFSTNKMEGPDHRNYPSYPSEWDKVKMAWMKKTVAIPPSWDGQLIKLYFEAVAGFSEIYVNRVKVAENFDLFLPFSVDITDKVVPGEVVEILVGVRSQALFEDNSSIGCRVLPAGSMWGIHIAGIWQDVFLLSIPKVHVEDIYVKPLVSKQLLEFEVLLRNNTDNKVSLNLQGTISEWMNLAGTDINSAPVPKWDLGKQVLNISSDKIVLSPYSSQKVVLQTPINSELKFWTPEHPNLYAVLFHLKSKKNILDIKYERFGWREWTLQGTKHCLNGQAYQLKGDSWHFSGIPQMSRRYAWAWFTAVKNMNGNAIRPHAQVYPRFYLDMADEMGICILDETANWASDGGPKLDSEMFWQKSKEHLARLVKRDRNHASVFGWSISNENKPVILYVFNRPDLMPLQEKAWKEWRDIVRENDSTRPWISSDGEDDGNGILPVTIGHYGNLNSMKHWISIGKPWGVGEHSMAYYGTPEQVSRYNGERAYESQLGRMEGLANECYNLLVNQRKMGGSYCSVFNMSWYALKPLPLGKKELTIKPQLNHDGVFFSEYIEGIPGVQPERIGPYSTTFNPGYDPSLPLYVTWPMYDAMRAANADDYSAWSPYVKVNKVKSLEQQLFSDEKKYEEVLFIGDENGIVKNILDAHGVEFVSALSSSQKNLCILDGSYILTDTDIANIQKYLSQGADIWIWGITLNTVIRYNEILPLPISLDSLVRSSFLPVQKSWMRGLNNSDFYFCELQKTDVSRFSLKGPLVEEGDVILNACKTDWRLWNQCAEQLKTASIIRSENECTASTCVFAKYQSEKSCYYVSTLENFANTEKGFKTLSTILKNAGIRCKSIEMDVDDLFFLHNGLLLFPKTSKEKFVDKGNGCEFEFYVYSPRPLDNLLIEPNMPKLSLVINSKNCVLKINDRTQNVSSKDDYKIIYNELPLTQGWNKLSILVDNSSKETFNAYFKCDNNESFLALLRTSFFDIVK